MQVAGEVGRRQSNAGFRVSSSSGDNVNAAPWYGIGQSNLVLPGGSGVAAVQLGGYYGLNFQTSLGQMVLNEIGNVGIGTTSPVQKLEVLGHEYIDAVAGAGNIHLNPNGCLRCWRDTGDVNDTVDNPLSSSGWSTQQIAFNQQNGSQVWSMGWMNWRPRL